VTHGTAVATTASVRRDRGSQRRAGSHRPPQHAPELAGLSLDELRSYRHDLLTEESRVSYWRRILHARLDLTVSDSRSLQRMRAVLTEHQTASRRLALTPVEAHQEPPPVPELAVLWEIPSDHDDDAMLGRLAGAEQELSAYRRSLHQRLDAATGELILRYRAQPALALRALPGRGRAVHRSA
jgi:hypothetical protein